MFLSDAAVCSVQGEAAQVKEETEADSKKQEQVRLSVIGVTSSVILLITVSDSHF